MKHIILFLILASFCGCKPNTSSDEPDLNEPRTWLFYDFKQITKYPELLDDDYENGDFQYTYYKDNDFVTVTICGVHEQSTIDSVLSEFKSVMKKRKIEEYLVVKIYEKRIRETESTSTLENLIQTLEIKEF